MLELTRSRTRYFSKKNHLLFTITIDINASPSRGARGDGGGGKGGGGGGGGGGAVGSLGHLRFLTCTELLAGWLNSRMAGVPQ